MSEQTGLPPVLQRPDFDSDEEYQNYLSLEAFDLPEQPTEGSEARREMLHRAAQITLEQLSGDKRTSIHLRIPSRNLEKIKAQALRRGIPYQTYINEIIHRAVRSPDAP